MIKMTYNEILKVLSDAGIENARGEATMLISRFGRLKNSMSELDIVDIIRSRDEDIGTPELADALEKRCGRYPLQYIFGEWGFYGLEFEVNENTLIPRSDTELIVDTAVKMLPSGARFADLCTGSGCICVAITANRTDCIADAVELYPRTLEVAKRNAEKNGVSAQIDFKLSDAKGIEWADGCYDAIISNPPYIRSGDMPDLMKEVCHEPAVALDGGETGMDFYEAIVSNADKVLKPDGFIIFELGYDCADGVENIAKRNGYSCKIEKDLCGNDRMAILKKIK